VLYACNAFRFFDRCAPNLFVTLPTADTKRGLSHVTAHRAVLMLSITLPFIFTRPISDESASPLHLRWMPLLTGALVLTAVASIAVPVGGFAWMYPQHYHMITRQEEERAFNEYWSSVGANASTLDGTARGTITGIDYERVIGERLKPLDALQDVEELEFVFSLTISHDGTLLASGGLDMTVRIWDLKSRRQLQVMDGVWGNHDFGLAYHPEDAIRARYSEETMRYMTGLLPRLEIGDCLALAGIRNGKWLRCCAMLT
jgi:hypothetical protein